MRGVHDSTPSALGTAGRFRKAVTVCGVCASLVVFGVACSDKDGSGEMATLQIGGENPAVDSIRVLDDFNVIVNVDPDASQSATFTIDDNLMDDVYDDVDDGELTLDFGGIRDVEPTETPLLVLNVKRFESVVNQGDGTVTVKGVDADEFEVMNGDDGNVIVHGTANSVAVANRDDGDVNLAGLSARRVDLEDTGDGRTSVRATDVLEGEVSGDADVLVFGHPLSTDVSDEDGAGYLLAA